MHFASEGGSPEIVAMLIEKSVGVNIRDREGKTPFMLAAQRGHVQVFEILARNGAEIDAHDLDWKTSLHHVCENGHEQVAMKLVIHGADISARTRLRQHIEMGQANNFLKYKTSRAEVSLKDDDQQSLPS